MASARRSDLRRLAAFGHAAFFFVSGLWPILHIRSFEWVSGPKVDRWLVRTISALIVVIGSVIGLAAWRRRLTPEIEALAVGSALSLAAIDVIYVMRRRIRWVYLLDAVAELGFTAAWLLARRRSGTGAPALDRP